MGMAGDRMLRKKGKIEIIVRLNKETEDLEVKVNPKDIRPTEIIQILLYAIKTVSSPLNEELGEEKKEKLPYIG